MEPVKTMTFRSEHVTEGKISINEDKATPIFPPYAGRVTRLMAKPGDTVERGQPLFYIEAADMVQAQNDFLTALAAINNGGVGELCVRARQGVPTLLDVAADGLELRRGSPLRLLSGRDRRAECESQ